MRIVLRFLVFFAPVILVAVWGSLEVMNRLEKRWLMGDLARRTRLISESTSDYLADSLRSGRHAQIEKLLNRITQDERLAGAALCSRDGKLIARSQVLPKDVPCPDAVESAIQSGELLEIEGKTMHEATYPILADGEGSEVLASLILVHDTSYMKRRHETTRRYVMALLVGLSLFFFAITLMVYRWSRSESVRKLKSALKGVLSGNLAIDDVLKRSELSPLARDLSRVMRELRHAKAAQEQAGKDRPEWNPVRLRSEVQKLFGDAALCVIANREPYIHNRKGTKIEVLFPASGLVTAVEPIVRACSGLWVGHGSGTADRETADSGGKLLVPPENPEYALKRVWLTRAEEQGYYYGFSNEGLWPLCHIAHARPNFDSQDWHHYQKVNEKFADAFAEEHPGENPVVLIQDYHFALLPQLIRARKPGATLSLFWHIPWPNPEAFGICPWKKELLRGMLGADVIGFHTQFHCNNFLDTVDRYLEARVDRERFSVTIQGHVCYVKPFPISVEWPTRHDIALEDFEREREELMAELNLPREVRLGIGVDRVDYTKGIIERLESVERFLDQNPEWVGKFVFVQIGAPSRTHIKRYQDLNAEVQEVADRINWKFASSAVPPILLKLAHHNAPELFRYYRAADVCFVSSLHDGMNLVCKEYISSRKDLGGSLVLSTFAGASRELGDALLVNPYDLDHCAEALHRALTMDPAERAARMERMRKRVEEHNVYAWAGAFLSEIHRIRESKSAAQPGGQISETA